MRNTKLSRNIVVSAILMLCVNFSFAMGNPGIAMLPTGDNYQYVFDINALPEISIEISPADWNILLSSSQYTRPKAQVSSFAFTKNGVTETVSGAKVKISGNTSFVNPESGSSHCINCADWVQANFNFDFSAQPFRGLTGLKFKRFRDDPSYVREVVANDIMQHFGIFTSHYSTYAKLYIHVTGDNQRAYFGVYRMNEDVNEVEYLTARFGADNDGGQLWKMSYSSVPNCDGPADLLPITIDSNKMSRDDCTYEFKGKKAAFAAAKESFVDFLNAINSKSDVDFKLYADQKINTDLLLKGMAAEAVLGQWDGMSAHYNNYFLYFDESGVMQFIPFDMDNTLGTSSAIIGDSGSADLIGWSKNILAKKMLSIPEYKAQYIANLNELVSNQNLLVETRTINWILARQNLIKNFLVNDTGDNGSYKDSPASWGNKPNYRIFNISSGTSFYSTKKAAVAAASANGFSHNFPQLYFRGTPNSWLTTPMKLVANNTWQLSVTFDTGTNPRFKVDVAGDWSNNYGDNNVDKILDKSGADIKVTGGKTYLITVNDITRAYTVIDTNVPNKPPVANAGPDKTVLVGTMVRFDGTASTDPDGTIVNYLWSNGIINPSDDFVYQNVGTYTETLTVTDDDGATATDSVVITVVDNFPPVANAGADVTVQVGQAVTLNGSASSDSNGSIVNYSWSNGLSGVTATTSFATPGTYTIVLTVTDNQGATATDSVVITVTPKPTGINVTFTCNNATTVAGQSVYAVGNISQLGGWVTSKAVKLTASTSSVWKGVINLPASTAVQWKCIKINGTAVMWEPGSNTFFTTPATGTASTAGWF